MSWWRFEPYDDTMTMLDQPILDELNRTIVKSMLGSDVLADLNRTITMTMLDQPILDELNRTIVKSMLGSDVLADLNRTITTEMLESTLKSDINRTVSRPFGATLSNPYGILGTAITDDNTSYTVAGSKVLMITSTAISLEVSGKTIRDTSNGDSSPPHFSQVELLLVFLRQEITGGLAWCLTISPG